MIVQKRREPIRDTAYPFINFFLLDNGSNDWTLVITTSIKGWLIEMPALNRVQRIGNLGKDPESRFTPTGKGGYFQPGR